MKWIIKAHKIDFISTMKYTISKYFVKRFNLPSLFYLYRFSSYYLFNIPLLFIECFNLILVEHTIYGVGKYICLQTKKYYFGILLHIL